MKGKRALGSAEDVAAFAGRNASYYAREFAKIEARPGFVPTFNIAAAVFGPLWAAARGVWGAYWSFLIFELFAWVQIGRGTWGQLGTEHIERLVRLTDNIARREAQAADLTAAGDAIGAAEKLKIAYNLRAAADQARAAADAADAQALMILLAGIGLLLAVKLAEGLLSNPAYEAHYLRWRSGRTRRAGFQPAWIALGALGLFAIWPLTLLRFTVAQPDVWLSSRLGLPIQITEFPVGKEYFAVLARLGDAGFDWLAITFGGLFDGIAAGIRVVLDGLEIVLIGTPWPVVMLVTIVMAFRLAGPRVAIFTTVALAYLAFMGLWELAMTTVALIGAGAVLCVVAGIPLGIWFGKSRRAYAFAEPLLDFMQTMPAFVYLIPIIAFFGTGKPPGVLATLIFAMPPVIRLTALGMRGVPSSIREAAIAFGCSRRQLLFEVELPLAMPSIMTGINQTILMALSMVVIASLIGAGGLGALILEALQYAAKGQGLLGGLAILACAMVIDRIAQGVYRRRNTK